MGIIALGTAIANLVTSEEVQNLKEQINDIVKQHKAISDKVMKLSQDLQKLNMQQLSKKLSQMNQRLSQNLQTIIQDQQQKLQIIKRIDVTVSGQDPQLLLTTILQTLNVVFTLLAVVQIMCATDPATIAISGVLLLISAILNVFAIVNNIEEIHELQEKKKELLEYYKPNGEFEQSLERIAVSAFQVVENFCMIVVGFRSMVYELEINVNLLSLSQRAPNLNYQFYINVLKSNPFDSLFEKQCSQIYKKFIKIQNLQLQQKVNQSCLLLQDFQNRYLVMTRLKGVNAIAQHFKKDAPIGKQLQRASEQVKKLTVLKERFQLKFTKRKWIQQTQPENLGEFDQDLLEDLMDQARKMDEAELGVAEVVSFYTIQFFGDDPTGKTLFKMNLKEVFEKSEFLSYLGVTSKNQNLIYFPRPEDPALQKEWDNNVSYLIGEYIMEGHQMGEFEFKKLYLRMELGSFEINGDKKSKLNYYYGILVKRYDSSIEQSIERQISNFYSRSANKELEAKQEIVDKVEKSSENLKYLCNQLCFFINGIAYPDRVLSLSMTKEENNYKYALEWSKKRVKPEFFGKLIRYSIEEGEMIQDKEKVLQVIPIKETNISIVLKQR